MFRRIVKAVKVAAKLARQASELAAAHILEQAIKVDRIVNGRDSAAHALGDVVEKRINERRAAQEIGRLYRELAEAQQRVSVLHQEKYEIEQDAKAVTAEFMSWAVASLASIDKSEGGIRVEKGLHRTMAEKVEIARGENQGIQDHLRAAQQREAALRLEVQALSKRLQSTRARQGDCEQEKKTTIEQQEGRVAALLSQTLVLQQDLERELTQHAIVLAAH